jgi:hypothetical protein
MDTKSHTRANYYHKRKGRSNPALTFVIIVSSGVTFSVHKNAAFTCNTTILVDFIICNKNSSIASKSRILMDTKSHTRANYYHKRKLLEYP